jgi:hypothetical protein
MHEVPGNRLDHADRDDREGAREVAREVHDLRALHAHRGLDLVARDHRAGIGRDHLHLHVEVEELALDQARGVLERLRRRALDVRVGRIEQRQLRQRRVGHVENSGTCFSRTMRSLFATTGRHLDADRLVVLEGLLRLLDLLLAHLRGDPALLAVAARLDARAGEREAVLDQRAHGLGEPQPGKPGEDAEGGGDHREQHQRAAGEAEGDGDEVGEHAPQHAARCVGQRRRERMQPQRLERAARRQQAREAGERDRERAPVQDLPGLDAAIEPQDPVEGESDPPPGGQAEDIEERFGDPRARHAALVGDRRAAAAEERARVARGGRWRGSSAR